MKKIIIKVIVFFIVLLIILKLLSYPFRPKNNSEEFGMHDERANGILGEPDNTIDVIKLLSFNFINQHPFKLNSFYSFLCQSQFA